MQGKISCSFKVHMWLRPLQIHAWTGGGQKTWAIHSDYCRLSNAKAQVLGRILKLGSMNDKKGVPSVCGEVVVLCFDGSIRGSGCDCQFWNISKRDLNLTCYCLPHAVTAGDCWYGWCYCSPCLLNFLECLSGPAVSSVLTQRDTGISPIIHVCPSAKAAFHLICFAYLLVFLLLPSKGASHLRKNMYACIKNLNIISFIWKQKKSNLIPFGEINKPNNYVACSSDIHKQCISLSH